ncbi:response regulator [Streptomyces sp. NPDC060194]|uniref:response regulator n=1 Tax=Streptomyces sp. NPDC060194 TaxID=3347069 RepID=UPI00365C3AB9
MSVLVVDDDRRVARINAAVVAKVPGFRVVALAHSVAETLDAVARARVDLVLLDHYLPDGTGRSRQTAQRYLKLLERSGRVRLSLRYGDTGRPEHRYVWEG